METLFRLCTHCFILSSALLAAAEPILPSPAVHWTFDETSGSTAYDSAPGSADASLVNFNLDACHVEGLFGGALRFDGQDDYMEAGGYLGVLGNADRTLCMWFKAIKDGTLLSYGTRDQDLGGKWIMRVHSGRFQVVVWAGNALGSTVITDGNWHHVAAVLQETTGDGVRKVEDIRLYVDGRLESLTYNGFGETGKQLQVIDTQTGEPVHVGCYEASGTNAKTDFFSGRIDDLRIYEDALGGEQIYQLAGESPLLLGGGTEQNPYQIAAPEHLLLVAQDPYYLDKHLALTADIDLGTRIFYGPVIGTSNDHAFTGVLDGRGHTICNLTVIYERGYSGDYYGGLFGRIHYRQGASSPVVKNLHLEDGIVEGSQTCGILAGEAYGAKFTNCTVRGLLRASGRQIGGMFGSLQSCIVRDCHVLPGTRIHVTQGTVIGGLAGGVNKEGNPLQPAVEDCSADAVIHVLSGGSQTGGLIGSLYNIGLTRCRTQTQITFASREVVQSVGGLVGSNTYAALTACRADGQISGTVLDGVGGLVGLNQNYAALIQSSAANVEIVASNTLGQAGGLVGRNESGRIFTSCAASYLEGATGHALGGLVGVNFEGYIENSYAEGLITLLSSTEQTPDIGGLIGYTGSVTIRHCYAACRVKVFPDDPSATIGSFIGNYRAGLVQHCFVDEQIQPYDLPPLGYSSSSDYVILEALPTAQMQQKAAFTTANWWFRGDPMPISYWLEDQTEEPWMIRDDQDYPRLSWQEQPPIADAGPDQTVFAGPHNTAQVTLDGSAGTDPEGNPLTYRWQWQVNGQTFQSDDVSPTLSLPVGVHPIELIVNDGYKDSPADTVTITVTASLEIPVTLQPPFLFRQNPLWTMGAWIQLPPEADGFDVSVPLQLEPWGIEATQQYVLLRDGRLSVYAVFIFDAITNVSGGLFDLDVTARLQDGQTVYGTAEVQIF